MKQIIVDNLETNYYITEDGKCYNKKTGKYLKGQLSNSGYLNFNLSLTPTNKKRFYAHRLVAQAYIENPENKKEVNHKDGNKLNNCVDNLEWVTGSENQQHAIEQGLRQFNTVYQYDENLQLVNSYPSVAEAWRVTGVSKTRISQEVNAEQKVLTKGYYWSFSDKPDFKILKTKNTGLSKTVYQLDKDTLEVINVFKSANEAARFLGVKSHSHISECCLGKIKTYKGYKWKYKDN